VEIEISGFVQTFVRNFRSKNEMKSMLSTKRNTDSIISDRLSFPYGEEVLSGEPSWSGPVRI
jgi:hypothetical protein